MSRPVLSSEIMKLLKRQEVVQNTETPAYRLLDILATAEADVGDLIVRFSKMKEPDMRKAFHDMAALLKQMEKEYLSERPNAASSPQSPQTSKSPATRQSEALAANPEALAAQEHILVFSDGASKGNPGDAAIAFVIADTHASPLFEHHACIGTATNNEAEYQALLAAMEKVLEFGKKKATFFSDSELIVNQVLGRWKINKPELLVYAKKIAELRRRFEKFDLSAIPREKNIRADFLANCAIKASRQKVQSPEGSPA
jgi:ribonuclease HI